MWLDVVTRCLAILELKNGRGITGLVFFDPGVKGPGGLAIVIFFIVYYTEKLTHQKAMSKIFVLNVSARAGEKTFLQRFYTFLLFIY